MKTQTLISTVLLSATALLTACNPSKNPGEDPVENPVIQSKGHMALVGGALKGCSSMVIDDCSDWETFRSTELGHLTDDEIRSPVELGVALTDANLDDVINDSAWGDSAFGQANEEILSTLQSTLDSPDYLYATWDDFRTAYIEYGDTLIDDGEGGKISGDDVWFSSSDVQYSTLEGLELVDDTFQYTVTEVKVDAVLSQADIAALNSELYAALETTLDDSVYSDPVLQSELIDYFFDINVVDATVNGWKLYKDYLSDAEYNFLLDTLETGDGTFVVDINTIATIESDETVDWDSLNQADVVAVLDALAEAAGGAITYDGLSDFRAAFLSTYLDGNGDPVTYTYETGGDVWSELTGLQQMIVLQGLVNPLVDYSRPKEFVDLSGSSDQDTIDVVQAIVDRVGAGNGEKPKFLIMTSSSNNSYDAVDYYLGLFEQAGADAQWLPVDRAYQDARLAQRCDLLNALHSDYANDAHIDLAYPDHAQAHRAACDDPASVLDAIAEADALFINGGGQRRSLDALMPMVDGERSDSPAMALIRERFDDSELMVGGTSAGTAVQGGGYLNDSASVNPMIDGGQSYDVTQGGFDDGIAVFEGGLGLFNYGITDTHFSERAREARLIKLAEQTGVRFGFGVDETTVLFVDKFQEGEERYAEMSVLGKGGVFVTDLADAVVAQSLPLDIADVRLHYLTAGDEMTLSQTSGEVSVELSGTLIPVDEQAATITNNDVMVEDNFRSMMTELVETGAGGAEGTSYEDSPTMVIEVSRTEGSAGHETTGHGSYTNLLISVRPE